MFVLFGGGSGLARDNKQMRDEENEKLDRGPRTCPKCNGKGHIMYRSAEMDQDGIFDGAGIYDCPECGGEGKVSD